LTAILIPKQIRDDGGFFNAAQKMAQDSNSTVTFVITPGQGTSLYQLQVSKQVPITDQVTTVKPLELFGVDKLQRSTYFDVGFFPLNSILDVTAISNDNISITNHGGNLAPSEIKDGQKFPTDLTKSGWIIDPDYGQKVSAVYLFGKDTSVTSDQAFLTFGNTMPTDNTSGQDNTTSSSPVPKTSNNYSIYVLIGIVAAGGAAVYLFMKRR